MKINILKCIIIYIILISSFVGMLVLTSSFSSQKIYNNVKESSEVLLSEGNRKIIYIPYRLCKMQFDNYTDALMINTAYSIDSKEPLYSAFVARKNYIPDVTTEIYVDSVGELKSSSKYMYHNEVGELNDLVNGEKVESFEYGRYWHGYLIFLRPLLALFNIQQIRIILTIFLFFLATLLIVLINKRINLIAAIVFLIGLLGVEYFYLGFSLQGVFVFIIMMITSIILLLRYNKIKSFGVLFFIVGMLTNFFDFLTVPIVTLMIPLLLYFLLRQKNEVLDIKNIFKIIFIYVSAWGIGYGVTWITKWLLIDLLFDKNMLSVAINQVLYRSTAKNDVTEYNMFTVINENLKYMILPLGISIATTFFTIDSKIALNKENVLKPDLEEVLIRILPYSLILCVPFCWYALLQNHSYYHAFFTYRNLIISNVCFNIIIMKIVLAYFKEGNKKIK